MESIEKRIETVQNNLEHWMTPEILTACFGMIDLTSLKSTDTEASIRKMTEKVNGLKDVYPAFPNPASICVFPNFSRTVRECLTAENVGITTVSGCFPASQSYLEVKVLESRMAVENGATEVDIVLALNSFLNGDYESCRKEIREIRNAVGKARLKVILETGALVTEEKIRAAAFLAMECGADFIKTSTGKMEPAATPYAAVIMCDCIREYYEKTGKKIGFKPAGGMTSAKDAIVYYAIADTILGKEWLQPSLLRFGASRVANSILSEVEKSTVSYF